MIFLHIFSSRALRILKQWACGHTHVSPSKRRLSNQIFAHRQALRNGIETKPFLTTEVTCHTNGHKCSPDSAGRGHVENSQASQQLFNFFFKAEYKFLFPSLQKKNSPNPLQRVLMFRVRILTFLSERNPAETATEGKFTCFFSREITRSSRRPISERLSLRSSSCTTDGSARCLV